MIREAWELYWKHFGALATIMLVVWVPCEFAENWIEYHLLNPDNAGSTFRLERFVDNFIGIIATSGVYYYLNEVEVRSDASVGQAFNVGFSYWWSMFVTRFIVGVGLILGFLLLIVPGIYLAVRLSLCELLVVTEDMAGLDCARRSFELTKGRFWRLFGWLVVGALPAVVPLIGIGLVLALVNGLDNWLASAIGGCFMDVITIYFFTLIRAIYVRLLAEERMHEETVLAAS